MPELPHLPVWSYLWLSTLQSQSIQMLSLLLASWRKQSQWKISHWQKHNAWLQMPSNNGTLMTFWAGSCEESDHREIFKEGY